MGTRKADAAAVRRWALRAAAVSARLEHREVPAGHVRSREVEEFLASTGPTATGPASSKA